MISSGALSSEEDLGKTSVEGGLDKEAVLENDLVIPLLLPVNQRSKAKVRVARSTPLNPFSSSPRRPPGGEKGGDFPEIGGETVESID